MLLTKRKPRWVKNRDNMHMTVLEENMGEYLWLWCREEEINNKKINKVYNIKT